MAWPPAVPPSNRTDATVMSVNHPADHNQISAALTELLNKIASMEQALYPIGTISMCGSDVAPGNHLLCQGQSISRSAYPEVFALIGTKFGSVDGNSFNLPNMQGRGPVGLWPGGSWAATLGAMIGSADAVVPTHDHDIAHEHGVNIFTSFTNVDHYHAVPLQGGQGFVVSAQGTDGDHGPANIAMGGPGYSVHSVVSNALGGVMEHRHAVNGMTDHGPTRSGAASGAVSPTNANIPPGVVLNFVMRMH